MALEARYFEGVETRRGGCHCGRRYDARNRRQIEATESFHGKRDEKRWANTPRSQSYSEYADRRRGFDT